MQRSGFACSLSLLILLAGCAGGTPTFGQSPLSTAFTYQGLLRDGGNPPSGIYDLQFILYTAPAGGTQVGSILLKEDTPVTRGLLRTELDFGTDAFDGSERWLEVGVRPGDSGDAFTVLSPRQRVSAVPYALYATRLPWAGLVGIPEGFADGVDNDTTYTAGPGLGLNGTAFGVLFGGNGTAETAARSDHEHAAWSLTGNANTDPSVQFLGTTDSQALEVRVNNVRALRIVPTAGAPNLIGGHPVNSILAGVVGGTIGGGGRLAIGSEPLPSSNRVTDNYGTVGGGINNQAGNDGGTTGDHGYATVAGGASNTASHPFTFVGGGWENTASFDFATVAGGNKNISSGYFAAIGGGNANTASGLAAVVSGGFLNSATKHGAAVGGGDNNKSDGFWSAVGGGVTNTAGGDYSTVPGGNSNAALGDYSFAAGRKAKANHNGTFVWADSTNADFASTVANSFLVRASGGVRFNSNAQATTGVRLSPGSGSWSAVSDVDAKTAFEAVDALDLLRKLSQVPVQTWQYKAQDASIRHIGPTAQEFYAAFGVGEDDRHISGVDADGVALAAIQGLFQLLQEKDARIRALERDRRKAETASRETERLMRTLQGQNARLEMRLKAIEEGFADRVPSTVRQEGWKR